MGTNGQRGDSKVIGIHGCLITTGPGSSGGDLGGESGTTVVGINGIPISGTPTDGQVLEYDAAANEWQPETIPIGGATVLTATYTATASDNGKLLAFNNPSNAVLYLPATPPSPQWCVFVENTAGAKVNINGNGCLLDGSASTLQLNTGNGCYIATDGTNYFTEQGTATGGGGGGGGGGTVTSVSLTMPAEYSVAGSPVTTFGTLAVAKASQAANQVYAGPASGVGVGIVQSASGNSTSGSVTVAFPTPNTAGNLLVAFGVAFGINNPTDSAGNTWVDSGLTPSNGINGRMWYVTSCHTGANSVTFVGGRAAQLHIYEISGQVLSAVLDQATSNQGGSSTTFTVTTSGAVASANEIVLACFNSNFSSTTSMTAGAGYTQQQSTFDGTTASGNVITTSQAGNASAGLSGPQTATATGNAASSYWFAMIGTFKLASGGSAGAPTFRALVAADIPPIPESGVTNLVSDLAAKAPLASPALSGTPTAPTAAASDNSTKIATTAFVTTAISSIGGTPTSAAANTVFAGPTTGANAAPTFRALVANDIPTALHSIQVTASGGLDAIRSDSRNAPGGAASVVTVSDPNNPALWMEFFDSTGATNLATWYVESNSTGTFILGQYGVGGAMQITPSTLVVTFDFSPIAPTPSPGDSTMKVATTAFVATSFAPLASPALSGTPTAPTAAASDNSTKIATTAFVQAAIGAGLPTTPEAANTVLAGPASGASAAPTFRALVTNDIPGTLNPISIGTPGTEIQAILIASNSSQIGSSKQTVIATNSSANCQGVPGSALAIGDNNYGWLLTLDVHGNVGIAASLNPVNVNASNNITAAGIFYSGANAGVTAGPFTSISSIQVAGGIVTGLAGSATEPANTILAGPTTGAAAAPTFRALVAADIPALPESQITNLVSDLAAKAPLASPALIGTPTAPTPVTTDSSPKIATTAFVQAAIQAPASAESANTVLAGPASGASAAPTWRALVAGDIPGTLNMTSFPGTGASGTQASLTINIPASGSGAALQVVGPGTGSNAGLFISNGTTGGYSLQIGTGGNTQPEAIMIGNNSPQPGSLKLTQIATGVTTLVNGVGGAGAVFGIADAGYKWLFNLDSGGNLGVLGGLYATTLQLNPTAGATGITVTGTVNMQIHIGDTASTPNYVEMALADIVGNYFTDAAVGDGILRSQNNLRLGKAGSPTAMIVGANIVDFPGANTITSAPPVGPTANGGWKITLYNGWAIGIASGTLAFKLGSGTGTTFLSIFGPTVLPANNGTTTTPDGNASASIGSNGVFYSGATAGVSQATSITGSSITALQTKGGLVTLLTSSSDERLKAVERPYEGGLDAVLKINPVYFRWNEEGAKYTGLPGDKTYLGFTAQNAQKAIAECVPGTEGDGYLSFDERPILAALCDAVKTLAARVKELEAKLK